MHVRPQASAGLRPATDYISTFFPAVGTGNWCSLPPRLAASFRYAFMTEPWALYAHPNPALTTARAQIVAFLVFQECW